MSIGVDDEIASSCDMRVFEEAMVYGDVEVWRRKLPTKTKIEVRQ